MRNGKHTLIYQSGDLLAFSPEAASKEGAQRLIESLANALAATPTPAMFQGG